MLQKCLSVLVIDFLVKGGEGEVQKAFAEIMETEDGQYEVGHVDIGDGGDWPHPEPEPGSHWIIVPPEGSRSHFIDPKSDLASELVTIVQLTIGDHVKTPWEIDHVEEAVRWPPLKTHKKHKNDKTHSILQARWQN